MLILKGSEKLSVAFLKSKDVMASIKRLDYSYAPVPGYNHFFPKTNKISFSLLKYFSAEF